MCIGEGEAGLNMYGVQSSQLFLLRCRSEGQRDVEACFRCWDQWHVAQASMIGVSPRMISAWPVLDI